MGDPHAQESLTSSLVIPSQSTHSVRITLGINRAAATHPQEFRVFRCHQFVVLLGE